MPGMDNPLILDAALEVDGRGSLAGLDERVAALSAAGLDVARLEIDSLRAPWRGRPDPSGPSFQSGCAPILALARARALLAAGDVDAVVIRGREPLRTGYPRELRQAHMAIWPGVSIPEAYTALAEAWMARHGVDEVAFGGLADALLDNYARTASTRGLQVDVSDSRRRRATRLFRYVDCANPNIDFEGAALMVPPRGVGLEHSGGSAAIRLLGVGVAEQPDGPAHVAELAGYEHLANAVTTATREAGLDVTEAVRSGAALLEAYTCFPPVPLGFLLAAGVVDEPGQLPALLAERPVTVTGGMNLARAPWNNPVLHALVVMHARLQAGDAEVGVLHGNGGLGGWQGVAVIGRVAGDAD